MQGMEKAWLVFPMYPFQRKLGSIYFGPQVLTKVPLNVLFDIFLCPLTYCQAKPKIKT